MSNKQLSLNEFEQINIFEEALKKIISKNILIKFNLGITYIVKGKIIMFSDFIKLLCTTNDFDFRLELPVDVDEFRKILEFLDILEWNKQHFMFQVKVEELKCWYETNIKLQNQLALLCERLRINHYFDFLKYKAQNTTKVGVFKTVVDLIRITKKNHEDSFENIDYMVKTFLDAMPPRLKTDHISLEIPVELSSIRLNAAGCPSYKGKFNTLLKDPYLCNIVDAIICDSFWFVICFFRLANQKDKNNNEKLTKKTDVILKRISKNYFTLFINLCDQNCVVKKKDPVMNSFPDFVAQCVYFSLFLSYPKSRAVFNDNFRKRLASLFFYIYNGLNTQQIFSTSHWVLDMGTGNIIENYENNNISIIFLN
jgi:hypothetical protein